MNEYDDLLLKLGVNGHNSTDLEDAQRQERAEHVKNEVENTPLNFMCKLKNWSELDFIGIDQVGTTHLARYYGVRRDEQRVFLGNATELFSFEKVRSNIMAQTGVILSKEHKKRWELVVGLIVKARSQPKDIGDDERDLMGYIAAYFARHHSSEECLPDTPANRLAIIEWSPPVTCGTAMWHFEGGRIIVLPDSMLPWISYHFGRRWEDRAIRTSLALLEFESYSISAWQDRKTVSQRVWRSQLGWASRVLNTEDVAEMPLFHEKDV